MQKKTIKSLMVIITILLLTFSVLGVTPISAATFSTTVDSAGDVGWWTSLALNNSGYPVIGYYDATNQDLKVAICGNITCTSGTAITTVDNVGDVGIFASLALNSNGFPVISYFDETNQDLKVVVCGNTTCTSGNIITKVDSAGFVGIYTSLVLNSSGFPVISYFDSGNGDLKVAVCGNATCTFGNTITTVDSAGYVGWFPSLKLNSNGFPVIGYLDRTNNDLKVAVCGNATCTSGNTLTTLDSVGNVGHFPSLVLNSNGFPVISYHDQSNNDLKVAICGNATCTSSNILTAVDTIGYVGSFTSLALNSSGFPVISYNDESNSDLKVAVCGNATCTSGNTLITVDNAGILGWYTSQELNNNGFPVVSYYDYTNQDLKVSSITPPTVVSTSLSTTYTGIDLSNFTVTFSEGVNDPTGNTDIDDVTNPSNYLLVNKGDNSVADTKSCSGGVLADDTQITVNSVSYDNGAFSSTVTLANALPVGSYRLLVCGSTSIVDSTGFPLNAGSDYTFDFVVNPAPSVLPATGFPQGHVTVLPEQPASKAYITTDLVLEIPSLNQKMTIVGIPQSAKSWDVTWLGNNAGWLEGSAFPTWQGNTVLTGHVWDSFNRPGPFAELKMLKYGDHFFIHAFGQTYTYEVRENKTYWAKTAVSKVFQHEELDWVTLMTCEAYNPLNGDYFFRRAVRAVLISVK
jgi:LPXTG-site transpeptidase (sortase) family protein